jgi:hypothetical protein
MKFPERMLRVKAEGSGDQDRWFNAIKSAQQAKVEGTTSPQSKQLDTFKMVCVVELNALSEHVLHAASAIIHLTVAERRRCMCMAPADTCQATSLQHLGRRRPD